MNRTAAPGIDLSRQIAVVLEKPLERVLDDPSLNQRDRLEALMREV